MAFGTLVSVTLATPTPASAQIMTRYSDLKGSSYVVDARPGGPRMGFRATMDDATWNALLHDAVLWERMAGYEERAERRLSFAAPKYLAQSCVW